MEQQAMYHYTNPRGWDGILNGQKGYTVEHPLTKEMVDSKTVRGWVIPHRKLISEGIEASLVPFEATSPAIFGLPNPTPQSWLQYRDCISVWDYLLSCCQKDADKLILLKLNLIEADNPLVFDYIHMRKMARDLSKTNCAEEYRKRLIEGNRDYWNSRVKINRYEGNFTLPEIAVFSAIPIERVEFLGERKLLAA